MWSLIRDFLQTVTSHRGHLCRIFLCRVSTCSFTKYDWDDNLKLYDNRWHDCIFFVQVLQFKFRSAFFMDASTLRRGVILVYGQTGSNVYNILGNKVSWFKKSDNFTLHFMILKVSLLKILTYMFCSVIALLTTKPKKKNLLTIAFWNLTSLVLFWTLLISEMAVTII